MELFHRPVATLWMLPVFALAIAVDREIFKDYDGVEKTLDRQPGAATG
jgi:hypothetical protein